MKPRIFFPLISLLAFVVAQDSATTAAPAATSAPAASSAPPASSAAAPPASSATAPPTATASSTPPSTVSTPAGGNTGGNGGTGSQSSANPAGSNPPDVRLKVPNLSVQRIELDVDNVRAEVNLAAEVAKLVTLNAGVQVGIQKVNITIAGVHAQLELIIRLGHLVDIVNRTLESLNLNPLLINLLDTVTDVVENVVGAVDGLLGSVVQGNTRLNYIIDNLGNIVQEVVGDTGSILSSIVGNYQQNMTYTGESKDLGNGLVQKTYKYASLGSLVNIIFNGLNQVVQATVVGAGGGNTGGNTGGTGSSSSTAAAAPTTSAAPAATSSKAS